ncbi:cation/H(+) antiporter 14-like [Silene latifolia]|uniref:cation/H(+) antiporter 14-like n=1 Tax=Silene latifolia TaxID=37657 RepID=UPI003D7713F7
MNAENSIWNRGLVGDTPLVCQYKDLDSSVISNKHDPSQNTSMILIYFILIFLITRATHALLRLLQQNLLTAQILAGILIGPSFLTRNPVVYDKLFPPGGTSSGLAAFIFGLALPDGPPLGMTLIDKFDTISTAISVALVLCCKGVVELSAYGMFKDSKLLTEEVFSLAILIMLVVTGVSIPIVKYLYDPSSKYMSTRRQTIGNSGYLGVIRILVCIYKEDNVAPMIQLLQVAKPRKETPLQVLVLQLFELVGSKQAILAPYDPLDTNSSHIVSAFKRLEKEKNDNLRTQHFTSTSPYSSMHDDICSLAFDKGINVIILPFHQNHGFDKTLTAGSSIRNVNRRVMRKAPCSVGVLIDKKSFNMSTFYSIVVLFLGGNDDHETLAYSRRMVEDSSINLTVMRIKSLSYDVEETYNEEVDEYIINDFLASTRNKSNVIFKQTIVEDGVGTIQIIRSIEEHVDLVLVGRYHDPKMLAITGLMDWSQWPELGAIGAMLTTWDFQFSVLVIQQQQEQIQEKLVCTSRQSSTNSLISVDDNHSMSSMSTRDDYFIVQDSKPFQYFKISPT